MIPPPGMRAMRRSGHAAAAGRPMAMPADRGGGRPYGAAQPILAGGRSRRFALGLLGGIGISLAGATVVGGTLLAGVAPAVVGTAQAVAAGAVLAVVSIAIVPHAFAQVSSRVATATVLGFIAGYLLS